MRAVREIDRQPMTTGKGENTADVITVLVRHHDRGQLIGRHTESGQPRCCLTARETTIQQHPGLAGIDNQRVALTAAAQRGEADHFN
jgi:hypothetical protein